MVESYFNKAGGLTFLTEHLRTTVTVQNIATFTGKQLCWSLILIKKACNWRPSTLLKWDSNAGVFLWILHIAKILSRAFFVEHLRWLLLCVIWNRLTFILIFKLPLTFFCHLGDWYHCLCFVTNVGKGTIKLHHRCLTGFSIHFLTLSVDKNFGKCRTKIFS